jgi:hypothetical protein
LLRQECRLRNDLESPNNPPAAFLNENKENREARYKKRQDR